MQMLPTRIAAGNFAFVKSQYVILTLILELRATLKKEVNQSVEKKDGGIL